MRSRNKSLWKYRSNRSAEKTARASARNAGPILISQPAPVQTNGKIQVAKLVDTNVQRSRFGRLYLNARFEINGITFRKSFTLPSEVDSFNDCQEFERFLFAIGATGEEDALYRLIGKTCKVRIGVTEHDREFIAEFVIEDDIFHLHPQR